MSEELEKKIRECLSYDAQSGVLRWKVPMCNNSIKAGAIAGSVCRKTGYRKILLGRINLSQHRIAWFLYYGFWPEQIDHCNGVKTDNRIDNLRDCTQNQNQHNRPLFRNNTSGVKGATWNKRNKKWIARVAVNGKRTNIGYFSDLKDAEDAIIKKRLELHGEFANNN